MLPTVVPNLYARADLHAYDEHAYDAHDGNGNATAPHDDAPETWRKFRLNTYDSR